MWLDEIIVFPYLVALPYTYVIIGTNFISITLNQLLHVRDLRNGRIGLIDHRPS